MAKKKPAEKPAEKKQAGLCPVTDEVCLKECESDECKATVSEDIAPKESSSKQSDLENHPKFAKYKTGGKPL